MPLLSFGGWTFGVSIPNWLNAALVQARNFNISQLGTDVANQNLRLVEMMNWTISDLLESNPSINQTIDYPNLVDATTLGSNSIPIPDDLMGQDIISMKFYDSIQPPWMLLSDCIYIGWYGWNQLERTYRPNPTLITAPANGTLLQAGQLLPGTVTTKAGSPIVQGTNTRFTSTASQLSGLLATAVATTALTGVGTAFLTELIIGSVVEINGTSGTILTVTNDTTAAFSVNFGVLNTAQVGFKIGGTALNGAVTLAAGSAVVLDSIPYVISSISSATVLTLTTQAQSALTGVNIIASTIVGEIPYRFQRVPIYRLAAYMVETTDQALYAELMAKYEGAMAQMQTEITKQLATQNANMSKQARPNNVMDLASLYPQSSYYNNYY